MPRMDRLPCRSTVTQIVQDGGYDPASVFSDREESSSRGGLLYMGRSTHFPFNGVNAQAG
jgi:hypothetical protein